MDERDAVGGRKTEERLRQREKAPGSVSSLNYSKLQIQKKPISKTKPLGFLMYLYKGNTKIKIIQN